MRILLDTHVLIWLVEGDKNLSTVVRSVIEDEDNSLSLSIASLWEITIKLSLGKLDALRLRNENRSCCSIKYIASTPTID